MKVDHRRNKEALCAGYAAALNWKWNTDKDSYVSQINMKKKNKSQMHIWVVRMEMSAKVLQKKQLQMTM